MRAPTISAAAQAQASMWASLARSARTQAELTNYAVGATIALLRDTDLTDIDRRYLADLIDESLEVWAS